MKYIDQVHECTVQIPVFEITPERLPEIADAFHRWHEALYTYSERDNTPELINIEVTVYGRSPRLAPPRGGRDGGAVQPATAQRMAYFEELGGYSSTPVYEGRALSVGTRIVGPALIEEPTTTMVVFPGGSVELPQPDLYVMSPSRRRKLAEHTDRIRRPANTYDL